MDLLGAIKFSKLFRKAARAAPAVTAAFAATGMPVPGAIQNAQDFLKLFLPSPQGQPQPLPTPTTVAARQGGTSPIVWGLLGVGALLLLRRPGGARRLRNKLIWGGW